MEYNELVDEIVARVKKKLDEQNSAECKVSLNECEPKQRLFILSPEHSEQCHELWDCLESDHRFCVKCALSNNYDCDVSEADVVVLRQVSNEILVKIATGMGDTPLTILAIKAILMGKKVIIPTEELELLTYRKTAPTVYYDHMLQYVALLKRSGVQLCDREQLYSVICEEGACNSSVLEMKVDSHERTYGQSMNQNSRGGILRVVKKVVTERDIHEAHGSKIKELQISEKTIITDLARDYARERGITFTVQRDLK